MVLLMTEPRSTLRPFQDPSFGMARNDSLDDVLILAWEAAFGDESEPWCGKAAAAAREEGPVQQQSCQIETPCTNEEDIIAREVKLSDIELTIIELATLV